MQMVGVTEKDARHRVEWIGCGDPQKAAAKNKEKTKKRLFLMSMFIFKSFIHFYL